MVFDAMIIQIVRHFLQHLRLRHVSRPVDAGYQLHSLRILVFTRKLGSCILYQVYKLRSDSAKIFSKEKLPKGTTFIK